MRFLALFLAIVLFIQSLAPARASRSLGAMVPSSETLNDYDASGNRIGKFTFAYNNGNRVLTDATGYLIDTQQAYPEVVEEWNDTPAFSGQVANYSLSWRRARWDFVLEELLEKDGENTMNSIIEYQRFIDIFVDLVRMENERLDNKNENINLFFENGLPSFLKNISDEDIKMLKDALLLSFISGISTVLYRLNGFGLDNEKNVDFPDQPYGNTMDWDFRDRIEGVLWKEKQIL